MAVSSGRNECKVFDANKNYVPYGTISGLEKGLFSCDFGNYTNKIAFGGAGAVIYVMSLALK